MRCARFISVVLFTVGDVPSSVVGVAVKAVPADAGDVLQLTVVETSGAVFIGVGAVTEADCFVHEANGSEPEANGSVPEANGSVPEANGSVPETEELSM